MPPNFGAGRRFAVTGGAASTAPATTVTAARLRDAHSRTAYRSGGQAGRSKDGRRRPRRGGRCGTHPHDHHRQRALPAAAAAAAVHPGRRPPPYQDLQGTAVQRRKRLAQNLFPAAEAGRSPRSHGPRGKRSPVRYAMSGSSCPQPWRAPGNWRTRPARTTAPSGRRSSVPVRRSRSHRARRRSRTSSPAALRSSRLARRRTLGTARPGDHRQASRTAPPAETTSTSPANPILRTPVKSIPGAHFTTVTRPRRPRRGRPTAVGRPGSTGGAHRPGAPGPGPRSCRG